MAKVAEVDVVGVAERYLAIKAEFHKAMTPERAAVLSERMAALEQAYFQDLCREILRINEPIATELRRDLQGFEGMEPVATEMLRRRMRLNGTEEREREYHSYAIHHAHQLADEVLRLLSERKEPT